MSIEQRKTLFVSFTGRQSNRILTKEITKKPRCSWFLYYWKGHRPSGNLDFHDFQDGKYWKLGFSKYSKLILFASDRYNKIPISLFYRPETPGLWPGLWPLLRLREHAKGCGGGNRYVKGGFRNLADKAIN